MKILCRRTQTIAKNGRRLGESNNNPNPREGMMCQGLSVDDAEQCLGNRRIRLCWAEISIPVVQCV